MMHEKTGRSLLIKEGAPCGGLMQEGKRKNKGLQNVLHVAAPWFFSCDALCNSFFCSSISESLAIILRLCVPQLIIRTGWIADQLLVRAKLNKLALLEHRDVFAEPAGG